VKKGRPIGSDELIGHSYVPTSGIRITENKA
jgi:hypothetical protein